MTVGKIVQLTKDAPSVRVEHDVMLQNKKLKEALGLALQYVPASSNKKYVQDEIDKINLLIKEAT